ncbi:MAG: Bro-N domain-containing protein [Huintestinicola sp.]
MYDLKVFKNTEFGELGVMLIEGKEYFPAIQCAAALGYKNPKDAIIRHCKGVVKHDLPTNGGSQTVNYIPEGDLYRLIVSSKLPAAEKFERWVFDEVLPSIL